MLPSASASSISRIRKKHARQWPLSVRNNTIESQVPLPHLAGVTEELNLMQYAMTVVANANVDEDQVYELAKAIHENKEALVAAHPSFMADEP